MISVRGTTAIYQRCIALLHTLLLCSVLLSGCTVPSPAIVREEPLPMTTTQPSTPQSTTPQSTTPTTLDLTQYRWENRLLLIFAPAAGAAEVTAQRQRFRDQDVALADRDLLIFYLFDTDTGEADGSTVEPAATADLRERLNVTTDFAVLLVGKDGGVKNQFAEAVAPEEIYALIDVMPMRQREMRED